MSELSVREQVTVVICKMFHPGANHDLPAITCSTARQATDAVFSVLADRFIADTDIDPTDRGVLSPDDPGTTRFMEGWDECRSTVLTWWELADPAVTR